MSPGVTAAAIHPDRKVGNQANPHTCSPCFLLRAGEGTFGEPLQEAMERNFPSVFCNDRAKLPPNPANSMFQDWSLAWLDATLQTPHAAEGPSRARHKNLRNRLQAR